MQSWLQNMPRIDTALGIALALAALLALLTRHRGGRFRGLGGWTAFWLVFGGILVALTRAQPWISLSMLAVLMFAGVRTFFFLAPVRPQDRYAILAAYLAIPFSLYPGLAGSVPTFLATVPVVLLLLFPVLASAGGAQPGMLDSLGRLLLGTVLFVFCLAHLGLFVRWEPRGAAALFGLIALAADLPQRLIGRPGRGEGRTRAALGVGCSFVLAVAIGFRFGPWVGLEAEDAARAAGLVVVGVTLGGVVGGAVLRDLQIGSADSRVGRGAFLDRLLPPAYAVPLYFHYLNHYA